MKYKSYQVYDNKDFFEKYIQRRKSGVAPNELIEKPIINHLVGDPTDKNILDLGCGDGIYGKELLENDANSYLGIDGSKNMFQLAQKNLKGLNANVIQDDIENLHIEKNKYDLVIARLVLHYIEKPTPLLKQIQSCLTTNGTFILSIEHPIITSCYDAYHKNSNRGNWIVDNYFSDGERINNWINKDVIKYHKTIEQYWMLFKQANFEIVDIKESNPIEANFEDGYEYKRRKRIPLFMMFKLDKK